MIVSENINVKLDLPVTTEAIEKVFFERGIKPLRWAIVAADENDFTISVSFKEKGNRALGQ